jgi:hypothetical protein
MKLSLISFLVLFSCSSVLLVCAHDVDTYGVFTPAKPIDSLPTLQHFAEEHKNAPKLLLAPFNAQRGAVALDAAASVTLRLSNSTYDNNADLIVSYSCLGFTGCMGDWIGLYDLLVKNQSAANYLDLQFIPVKDRTDNSGDQQWKNLLNLRTDLQFRYYSRWNGQTCDGALYSLMGKSPILSPNDKNEPTQVHLALTQRPDQVILQFVTNNNSTAPLAYYSTELHNLTENVARGSSWTYTAFDMCDAPANQTGGRMFINPGFMQQITLSGLKPLTKYYYTVSSGGRFSEIFSFLSPPPLNYEGTISWAIYAGNFNLSLLNPEPLFPTISLTIPLKLLIFRINSLL